MNIHLAAAAANCNVGTWRQRWDCGWNQPTVNATGFGHKVLPWLIVLTLVFLVVRSVRKRRSSRSSPAPAGSGRARAAARR